MGRFLMYWPRGHTHAPTVMMAERAAELIRSA